QPTEAVVVDQATLFRHAPRFSTPLIAVDANDGTVLFVSAQYTSAVKPGDLLLLPGGVVQTVQTAGAPLYAGNAARRIQAGGAVTATSGQVVSVWPMGASVSATTDFAPADGSPAIGIGVNLSSVFSTDITGAMRPAMGPWDVGPYQH